MKISVISLNQSRILIAKCFQRQLPVSLCSSQRYISIVDRKPLNGCSCSAYGVTSSKSPLEPMTITRRKIEDNDVGIDIKYCGICHSDLHWIRNEWKDSKYPMIPGHEIIGKVAEVGANVKNLKVGDKVGVGLYVDSCRQCDLCSAGLAQHCPKCIFVFNSIYSRDAGQLTKGGFSKYIVVDKDHINTIPDELDFKSVAPLLCAGVTVFTPMRKWKVGPGCKFAVNGLGGLGHLAVKLGVAMGADVTVLSHSEKKRNDAERLGASDFVVTTKPSRILSKMRRQFDSLLDTVTVPHDLDALLGTVKIGGVLMLIGIPEHPLSLMSHSLVLGGRCMAGSLIGNVDDVQKVIDFCAGKQVLPDVEHIKMSEVNEAMERMLQSQVRYRFVIDMDSLK